MSGGPTLAGAVLGVIGLALLLVQSIRAFTGSSLSTLGTVLLYGGLGLLVVAGVSAIVAIFSPPAAADVELDR